MHPGVDDRQVAADHDPVEPRDRAAGVEAGAGGRGVEVAGEILETAARRAPFVEVAHQHGRVPFLAAVDVRQDRMRLPPPPQSAQVEVHPDHPQADAVDGERATGGAAGFERGEVERLALADVGVLADQDRIAVPAAGSGAQRERHHLPVAMFVEQMRGQHRGAHAEAAVGLLQRDHVGIDLTQYLEHAFGRAAAIGADPLAHVVAGDFDSLCDGLRDRGHACESNASARKLVPAAGIEPATSSLQNWRSTN